MKSIPNIIIVILSIIISFIFFEIFLYINNYIPQYKVHDQVIGDYQYSFNDDPVQYFNDNKFRTIFIGDSFTFGKECAHNKKDFVNLIKLNKSDAKNSYYNFGSRGISPLEMISIYRYLKQSNIDKLVLVLYYNDIFLSDKSCSILNKNSHYGLNEIKKCSDISKKNQDTSNDTSLKKIDNFLELNLLTWRMVKVALANSPYFSKFYSRSEWSSLYQDTNSEEFQLLIDILKYFKRESKENNFEIIFTYFPDVTFIDPLNKTHSDWLNFIEYAKKTAGINISDPWPYFIQNSFKKDLTWSLTDDHPNCEAHEIMYNFVNEKLM